MPAVDKAFEALEHVDEKGRHALRLAGEKSEETLRGAEVRKVMAEWLLTRLLDYAEGWGLSFDVSRAVARWEALPARPLPVRRIRGAASPSETIQGLRARLDEALDGREQAEIRAFAAEAALGLTGGRCAAERSLS